VNVLKWVGAVFAAFGTILLIVGIVTVLNQQSFLRRAVAVPGDVVAMHYRAGPRNRGSYYLDVRYTASDGITRVVTVQSASNPPNFKAGDRVPLFYDPRDPSHIQINTFTQLWILPLILGGLGLIFSGLGYTFLGRSFLHWRKVRWLLRNGQRIQATFVGMELNRRVSYNGAHPWKILVRWENPLTGEVKDFTSDDLLPKPRTPRPDEPIDVYVDPRDDRRYTVDASSLKRKK